jgi:hypothetical protein
MSGLVLAQLRVGDGRGVQQTDEAPEGLALAVVRGRRGQQHAVGAPREATGEPIAQVPLGVAAAGDVVRLVDDDHVPAGVFQEVAVTTDVLQRVDGDDDAVVDLEGVLRGRDLELQLGEPGGVQADQGQGEAVPKLCLKLRQHGLLGQHQDAVRLPALQELGQDHADLDGLAEAHGVGEQQPWAQLQDRALHGFFLVTHGFEGAHALDVRVRVRQRHLPKLGLEEQLGLRVAAALIGHQPGLARVDRLDAVELGEEGRLVTAGQLIGADAMDDLVLAAARRADARDQPLGISTEHPHAGRKNIH